MRISRIGAVLAAPLLAACSAAAQGNPPQRPAESQRDNITIPEAQQPPQQQRRERARTPGEQQPQPSSAEPAQGQQPRRAQVPEEKTVATHHSARIGGQQIGYTATAGTYVIKSDDDTPKATFFYVVYEG